jgi:CheY-like chemotaxis protein
MQFAPLKPIGSMTVTKAYSILVVDDDDNLVYTLSLLLRAQGYEVYTANDGLEGFGRYFDHPTEFVVTDIQMPKMDGFEMMRCIRSINPDVKTIYASGNLERFQQDVEFERREHDVTAVPKPYSTRKILELVNTHRGAGQAL